MDINTKEKMFMKIVDVFEETRDSIKELKSDPINSLGYLILVVIGLIALISGIVTYVMYIVNGGYPTQLKIVKSVGKFDDLFRYLSTGTVGLIFTKWIRNSVIILLVTEFFLMLANYFVNCGRAKKIIMTIDMVILIIQAVLAKTTYGKIIWAMLSDNKYAYENLKPMKLIPIGKKEMLITYVVITLIAIILFNVLIISTSYVRWMLGYSIQVALLYFVIVPLVFLLLENIIILGAIALICIISALVIGFVLLGVSSSSGESSSSSGDSFGSSINKSSSNSRVSTAKSEPVEKEQYQKKLNYDINTIFWRDKNRNGGVCDAIYHKDMFDDTVFVCSVSDYEKGKVAIYNKGKRVINIGNCKTPER